MFQYVMKERVPLMLKALDEKKVLFQIGTEVCLYQFDEKFFEGYTSYKKPENVPEGCGCIVGVTLTQEELNKIMELKLNDRDVSWLFDPGCGIFEPLPGLDFEFLRKAQSIHDGTSEWWNKERLLREHISNWLDNQAA